MADSEDAHPTLPPPPTQDEPAPAAEGSSSRRSSTAPGGGDLDLEPSAARKHGLDTSLILNEPRKRAKRESVEGVGVPIGQGKGKRKESQQQIDEPAYVLDKGMRLLDAVRDAAEGASPACVPPARPISMLRWSWESLAAAGPENGPHPAAMCLGCRAWTG
jgi:hypothetical protein